MLYMVSINNIFQGFYNLNEIKNIIIEDNKNKRKFINEIKQCNDIVEILWTLLFYRSKVKIDYEFIEVKNY